MADLSAACVGHDVRVGLVVQALAVVQPQQHNAVPQEASHMGEQLQVEHGFALVQMACHAVGCVQAHQLCLRAAWHAECWQRCIYGGWSANPEK